VYASNAPAFHAGDGSGYAFLADTVLALDAINPQVAARIVGAFNKVGKVDALRAGLCQGSSNGLLCALHCRGRRHCHHHAIGQAQRARGCPHARQLAHGLRVLWGAQGGVARGVKGGEGAAAPQRHHWHALRLQVL
jgi:hypothetical protein